MWVELHIASMASNEGHRGKHANQILLLKGKAFISCSKHYTNFSAAGAQEWGGTIYLERHNVACPSGEHLQQWQLVRDSKNNNIKIGFTCCGVKLSPPSQTIPAPELAAPTAFPEPSPAPSLMEVLTEFQNDDGSNLPDNTSMLPSSVQCSECRVNFSTIVQDSLDHSINTFMHYSQSTTLVFSNVCTVDGKALDLQMDIAGYQTKPSQNGVSSHMYKLNVKLNTNTTIKFTLLDFGGPTTVNKVLFSVLDIDADLNAGRDQWISGEGIDDYRYGDHVAVSDHRNCEALRFDALRHGHAHDNPSDPMLLSPKELSSSVALIYELVSEWTLTFGVNSQTTHESGRNFYLAGSTQLLRSTCPEYS